MDRIKTPRSCASSITSLATIVNSAYLQIQRRFPLCHQRPHSTKVSVEMTELEGELNPNIWSNLPYDILLEVIVHSDLPTQVNWSRTSRAILPIASCEIWHSLRLRSSEISAYRAIVTGRRPPLRADSIIHFLLESSYRPHDRWGHVLARNRHTLQTFVHRRHGLDVYLHPRQLIATLPISRVKDLEIDNQGFDDQHPRCNRLVIDLVLSELLRRLPNLQSFHYLGPVSPRALRTIVEVSSLTALQIRSGNDELDMPTRSTSSAIVMPWGDRWLDWSVLANLKSLQALEVGRLIFHEAPRLAKGVASLNLRRLQVSCWGWESGGTDPGLYIRFRSPSPLLLFLKALPNLELFGGDPLNRGLPSTLEHLVLIDKYYDPAWLLHQLIATAILPCNNLETLSTTFIVNGEIYDNISKMGFPAYQKIVGINSWQQLSSDEGMKVLHQYRSPSGELRQTNPYPRPVHNIFKTLDRVNALSDGQKFYRMSMKFVRDCHQFRGDEIIVYPGEKKHGPSPAERWPHDQDASMGSLATEFESLSLDETFWAHILHSWGAWSEW